MRVGGQWLTLGTNNDIKLISALPHWQEIASGYQAKPNLILNNQTLV